MNSKILRRIELMEKKAGNTTREQEEAWKYFAGLLDHAAGTKARGDETLIAELTLFISGGHSR